MSKNKTIQRYRVMEILGQMPLYSSKKLQLITKGLFQDFPFFSSQFNVLIPAIVDERRCQQIKQYHLLNI